MLKKQILGIVILLLFGAINIFAQQPPNPSWFWGTVKINGIDAPVGTKITPILDNVEDQTAFVVNETLGSGKYSILVNADNPSTTEIKEGGVNGDQVIFKAKIGETEYILTPTGTWDNINTQELNLSDEGEIPVELSSFVARSQNNSVNLFWTTVSESNNFGFEIQRSTNNKNFIKIGFRKGQGTTTLVHNYKYSDFHLPAGEYYYRLKQIDTDGASSFSHVIKITLSMPLQCKLLQNYPNPFNPITTIQFEIPVDSDIAVNIYDLNAHLVRTLFNGFKSAGIHSCVWDGKNENGRTVSNGVYLYRISSGQFSLTRKMILAK